jgi:hypothetical protein
VLVRPLAFYTSSQIGPVETPSTAAWVLPSSDLRRDRCSARGDLDCLLWDKLFRRS